MRKLLWPLFLILILTCSFEARAQEPSEPRKANERPIETSSSTSEPFDGASIEKLAAHCVTLETELGNIEIEMIPESAPEAVRNFLNLAATGALDTTTFSRTVKGFVVQGGNLSTSEKWGYELSRRMARRLPDEPGIIKHVRGIVSMAGATNQIQQLRTFLFWLVKDNT